MWVGSTRLGIQTKERVYDCSRILSLGVVFVARQTGSGLAL